MAKRAKGAGDEVSRLYSLPLEEFTAERDRLARRLSDEGDREGAAEVRKLKKPNLPAWAINQGVRGDPGAAEELIQAGERLQEAHTAALEGGDAAELREAMVGQNAAVEQMMRAVEAGLDRTARSDAILDRARETLRALAGDEELRDGFRAGRLTNDREAVGFGGAVPAATARRGRGSAKKKTPASAARRRAAERAEKAAQRSLDLAVKRVTEAKRRLERAEAAVDAAQAELEEVERDQLERESDLADARAMVSELRE
jgi:hypothetical protein